MTQSGNKDHYRRPPSLSWLGSGTVRVRHLAFADIYLAMRSAMSREAEAARERERGR